MKTIKFILMGHQNVGKSTLVEAYLKTLKNGCLYADHTVENSRYHVNLVEIETIEALQEHLLEHVLIKNIYFVCFNVNDRQTLHTARSVWILELLKHNPTKKIFLVGLQCDLREQILTKLKQDYVSYSDGVSISRYYENVQYVECISNNLKSVKDLFDAAMKMALDEENAIRNEKILEFYEKLKINFKFENL